MNENKKHKSTCMGVIEGIKIGVAATGISKKNTDLLLVVFSDNCSVAGSFTKSTTCSRNIDLCRQNLKSGKAKALVVNSGNANAFNGKAGEEAVQAVTKLCSELFNCSRNEVYFSSTGIIGEPLPLIKIEKGIRDASCDMRDDIWHKAACSIMTTDTYPKMVTKSATIDGKEVTINAICKGAGMIAPNMATTLGYLFTNASIPSEELQKTLDDLIPLTFNSITIDGDRSTSDTVMLFATNQIDHTLSDLSDFKMKLHEALLDMALMIVRDAEGTATKLIEIVINGALSWDQAHMVGMSIANSMLVKCAFGGTDKFNWGRVVMAIGKTDIVLKKPISIFIGEFLIVENNEARSEYDKEALAHYMKSSKLIITVDLAMGNSSATCWTCNLTEDYIRVNSDYLT